MPTALDNALGRHSKTLILVFSAIVVAATLPVFASGLLPSSSSSSRGTKPTIPKETKIEDDDARDPAEWSETELTEWLAKVSGGLSCAWMRFWTNRINSDWCTRLPAPPRTSSSLSSSHSETKHATTETHEKKKKELYQLMNFFILKISKVLYIIPMPNPNAELIEKRNKNETNTNRVLHERCLEDYKPQL